jgi:hypothetical protein
MKVAAQTAAVAMHNSSERTEATERSLRFTRLTPDFQICVISEICGSYPVDFEGFSQICEDTQSESQSTPVEGGGRPSVRC